VRFEVAVEGGSLPGHSGGSGPTALVLHGGPGLPDYMAGCAAELGVLFSTIRYTQRGTPPSTAGRPYSVETHVADALAVLDALEVERVWLVGHSWGGHLALHLAVAHPDRVEAVVCVDTLGASDEVMPDFIANLTRNLTRDERLRVEEIEQREGAGTVTEDEELEELAILWPHYFADPEAATPFLIERIGIDCHIETRRSMDEHFEQGTLEKQLPKLRLPLLFVHGEQDPLPSRASLDTAALVPDASVELLADCGHFPWLEKPSDFRRALHGFLARTEPSKAAPTR
jgi:pimeloyl-ACP methyl ester carboxylesterase